MEMEQLLDLIEHRYLYDDDADRMNADMICLSHDNLSGLDPYEVIEQLAQRNPTECYAWEPVDHIWKAGYILTGTNHGPEEVCRDCHTTLAPWWTNMVEVPCGNHRDPMDDLMGAMTGLSVSGVRQTRECDHVDSLPDCMVCNHLFNECQHWQQQCFPQGGCGCPCTGCEYNGMDEE